LVRFSVMKILSGWFFKPFLLLYTLLRVLYETTSRKILINNRDDILDFIHSTEHDTST
jgi:hypothetical protein